MVVDKLLESLICKDNSSCAQVQHLQVLQTNASERALASNVFDGEL